MSQHRQLAAIMFTDIEGYSALMQRSEQKAISLKDRHRKILQKEHKQFNGRIIQYYGDGTLSIFQSVVEAAQCAMTMQLAFRQKPRVPVRIGLHIGDVVFDEEQVFGDGVNLASRIESIGIPGSVLISDKVNDEMLNHPELKTTLVGRYQFKNIEREVEVFALVHEQLVIPTPDSLKGQLEEKAVPILGKTKKLPPQSIAVLPFVNMSNDPEQEYFSDGMAGEILNALSNVEDLKVAGRTSSFQLNKTNSDLREIGEKLGVSTVLEGSVRKQGNRLRVVVQLINVEDGFHLWSEKYDRTMDDVFAVQDEIALAITEKLKGTLLKNDRQRMSRPYTQNTEAYELYLKGRFHTNRRGASIITGLHYFQQAIDVDPDFALAHTGYADANLLSAFYGLIPPVQAMDKAKQSADIAIKLDPALCEPYCSLGCYHTFAWNWAEAEKYFLKSIALNPQYPQAHLWYGLNYLAWAKGDFEKAEKHGQIAVEQDPFSSISNAVFGGILYAAGKFDEALQSCKKGLELDAYSFLCRMYEGNAYMALKQFEEAKTAFEKAMKISNRHHFAQNGLIIIYCEMGNFDKAHALMEDLKQRQSKSYIASTFMGLSAAFLNNMDEAFDYLEKAFNDREPALLTLKFEYWVPDKLKSDPRFQKLIDRIRFPN